MSTKIIMPSGGQTSDESRITKWHKELGEKVHRGDILFEIETDKAVMEVESYAEGVLLEILHREDEMVAAGVIVGYIGEEGSQIHDHGIQTDTEDEYRDIIRKEDIQVKVENDIQNIAPGSGAGQSIKAYPAARRYARSKDLDIAQIAGEFGGRVIRKQDVQSYLEGREGEAGQECYDVETSKMRRAIAEHMVSSITHIPHYTVSIDADMTEALNLREAVNSYLADEAAKVSYNDIMMKCACLAIKKYPLINSVYGYEKIRIYTSVNFGLAVSLKDGLVVTVVKNTEKKTLLAIAAENKEKIKRAMEGRLFSEDTTGGTITLSNLGMFGVDRFTAIINSPESCILAAGSIAEKPVARKGRLEFRKMMTLTASFDHRVIDGAYGAAFLGEMKKLLENPSVLLL